MKMLIVTLMALLVCVAAPAGAQTVVNGGFEDPLYDGQAWVKFVDGDDMGGWLVTASEPTGVLIGHDTLNVPPRMADMVMPEGTQFLHIGESARLNTISQEISGFTIGGSYALRLASMDWGPDYPHELGLKIGSLDTVYTGSPARDPAILNDLGYSTHPFIALGETQLLEITNFGGTALTLDDISIVPEPATMALLGLGGLLLRRKRR